MQGKVLIAQKTQLLIGLCDSVFQKQEPETWLQKPKSKVEGQCATTLINSKMAGIQYALVQSAYSVDTYFTKIVI